jgi:hypothetical protein
MEKPSKRVFTAPKKSKKRSKNKGLENVLDTRGRNRSSGKNYKANYFSQDQVRVGTSPYKNYNS